jgi:transposase
MVKCTKKQIRRLKTALRWKGHPEQRQRIQMVLLRESGMTQPVIAEAMGVSLSTVNRAHMAYDHGGLKALRRKPSGGRKRENMTLAEEKGLVDALCQSRRGGRAVEHPRSQGGLRKGHRACDQLLHCVGRSDAQKRPRRLPGP